MRRHFKILAMVIAGMIGGAVVQTDIARASWRKVMNISKYLIVGGRTPASSDAVATIYTGASANKGLVVQGVSAQSDNLQEWQNSSGTAMAKVASDGDLTAVDATLTGALAVAGAMTPAAAITVGGKLTVNDQALIDGDSDTEVQLTVDGSASQSVDIVQVRASDGTEYLDVSSAGVVGAKAGLVVTESVDANSDMDVAGPVRFAMSLQLGQLTADPCGDTTNYPEGALFWNATSHYLCVCDGTNDVKVLDGSTACF